MTEPTHIPPVRTFAFFSLFSLTLLFAMGANAASVSVSAAPHWEKPTQTSSSHPTPAEFSFAFVLPSDVHVLFEEADLILFEREFRGVSGHTQRVHCGLSPPGVFTA